MTTYLLAHDLSTSYAIQDQLSAFIKRSRHIDQWSQPFLGVFFIRSSLPLVTLADDFKDFFAGKTLHIVLPVDPNNAQGILPMNIWAWVQQPEFNLSALGGLGSLLPRMADP